jgi:hypothetical protein
MWNSKAKKENRKREEKGNDCEVSPFCVMLDREGAEAKDHHRIQSSERLNRNFHSTKAVSSRGASGHTPRHLWHPTPCVSRRPWDRWCPDRCRSPPTSSPTENWRSPIRADERN